MLLHFLLVDVRERGHNDWLSGVVLCNQAVDHDLVVLVSWLSLFITDYQIISKLYLISLGNLDQVVNFSKVNSEVCVFVVCYLF